MATLVASEQFARKREAFAFGAARAGSDPALENSIAPPAMPPALEEAGEELAA